MRSPSEGPEETVTDGPLLALVGPTAAGKTEASLAVAQALGAEIVCVDSTLVYRGMDVGTAKPTGQDRAEVPHHLLDLVDPGEPFTVADFQSHAARAIEGVRSRGCRPLVVGGGGLYYRAVVDGLEFPGTVASTRRLLEAEAFALGAGAIYQRLVSIDPEAAEKIPPANLRRIVRALEVAAVTGRPFSSFARAWDRYPRRAVRAAGIDVARPLLHGWIRRRVRAMMPGLLEETERLLMAGFGWFLTSSRAIGYAEAVACLHGRIGREEAIAGTVKRTTSLARRQMVWFRRDPRIRWFAAGPEGAGGIVDELTAYLGGRRARPAAAGVDRS